MQPKVKLSKSVMQMGRWMVEKEGGGWDRRWVKCDLRLRKKIQVAAECLFFFGGRRKVERLVTPPAWRMDHLQLGVSQAE